MWPGTADLGGWRSPQASAGTPNNTRELAQIDKKKPQLIAVGASVLVGGLYRIPCRNVGTAQVSAFRNPMLPPKLPPRCRRLHGTASAQKGLHRALFRASQQGITAAGTRGNAAG